MARRKPRTLSDVIARRREHIALRDGYLSLIVRVLALAAAACLLFTQVNFNFICGLDDDRHNGNCCRN